MTTPILPESLSLEQLNTALSTEGASALAWIVTAIAAGLIFVCLIITLAKLARLVRETWRIL